MKELIDIHFKGQLYFLNIIEKTNYDISFSNLIDDEYWNLAYLKNNEVDLKETFENVKADMQNLNRKPIIYIPSNIVNSTLKQQIEENLQLLYTDVWMTMKNLEKFPISKSKIEFSTYQVDKNMKDEFIQAVMDGFSGDNPEDPYESLSDGYRVALEKSFDQNDSEYKIIHYLGKKDEEAISTATVVYKNDKAIIYNVTTNKKYKRQGICKQMMSDIIHDLVKLKIKEICVQTEKGFYTEEVYKNMGFEEVMLGKAYVEKE